MVTDANCKLHPNKLIINAIFVVYFQIYIYVAGNLANVTAKTAKHFVILNLINFNYR